MNLEKPEFNFDPEELEKIVENFKEAYPNFLEDRERAQERLSSMSEEEQKLRRDRKAAAFAVLYGVEVDEDTRKLAAEFINSSMPVTDVSGSFDPQEASDLPKKGSRARRRRMSERDVAIVVRVPKSQLRAMRRHIHSAPDGISFSDFPIIPKPGRRGNPSAVYLEILRYEDALKMAHEEELIAREIGYPTFANWLKMHYPGLSLFDRTKLREIEDKRHIYAKTKKLAVDAHRRVPRTGKHGIISRKDIR